MTASSRGDPDQSISPLPPDLALAIATLRRGTRFLAAGLHSERCGNPAPILGDGRAKVIGNGLREVDRFFSLLVGAVARHVVTPRDCAALDRLDNSARRLSRLRDAVALASPDDAALRAIGRARNCLFHTGGIVRAGRPGCTPTVGWSTPDRDPAARGCAVPVPIPVGSVLVVSPADLARVCRFYDHIADDLIALITTPRPPIDLSRPADYMEDAHVACDGI